jgi:hypothetical protein
MSNTIFHCRFLVLKLGKGPYCLVSSWRRPWAAVCGIWGHESNQRRLQLPATPYTPLFFSILLHLFCFHHPFPPPSPYSLQQPTSQALTSQPSHDTPPPTSPPPPVTRTLLSPQVTEVPAAAAAACALAEVGARCRTQARGHRETTQQRVVVGGADGASP